MLSNFLSFDTSNLLSNSKKCYTISMSLQDLFYLVGLAYMTMGIVLLIALVFAVFYIKKKVNDMHRTFDEKLEFVRNLTAHPAESAVDIGASLAEAAVERIRSTFDNRKKKK